MSFTRVSSALLLSLGLAACDGTTSPMDAGMLDAGPPDSGPPDAGPPLACNETHVLEPMMDETVTLMLDTSMTETRPRDLGLTCGNTEAELRWAPEEVVELRVPGTGQVAVELDTVFAGATDAGFNTVLQVRTACENAPTAFFPPTCFDDVSQTEFRSRGSFTATGGQTYYIIVTGYSHPPAEQRTVDRGRVRLDVTVHANASPTVTSGSLYLALDDALIHAVGNDPDGDARGIAMNFYDASGLLDIYGDGQATEDGDVYAVLFDPAPTTADYDGRVTVLGTNVNLAAYLRGVGATRATFRVFDSAYAMSAPFDVDIVEADVVGFGEVCDETHVCAPEMSCVSGTCGAVGPVATACNAAIDLGVLADGNAVTRDGTTGAGQGNFACSADCASAQGSIGAEAIYKVEVPADTTADLIVTTNVGTGDTDTIVYVRGACPDSTSQLACNDDRAAGDYQSDVSVMNLTTGTYYVFVERWGGLASGTIPHSVQVTLRPVLASGATCDGTHDRCATGTCTGGVCP